MLLLKPISLREANSFVLEKHRHHKGVQGYKFAIAALTKEMRVCGVVIVGRPVSYRRDDGFTAEVSRLCTDGTPNACSFLYAAAAKTAFGMGYRRISTYTLPSEGGASLRATGWCFVGARGGGSWNSNTRLRVDKAPTEVKHLYEKVLPSYFSDLL